MKRKGKTIFILFVSILILTGCSSQDKKKIEKAKLDANQIISDVTDMRESYSTDFVKANYGTESNFFEAFFSTLGRELITDLEKNNISIIYSFDTINGIPVGADKYNDSKYYIYIGSDKYDNIWTYGTIDLNTGETIWNDSY